MKYYKIIKDIVEIYTFEKGTSITMRKCYIRNMLEEKYYLHLLILPNEQKYCQFVTLRQVSDLSPVFIWLPFTDTSSDISYIVIHFLAFF